jgi:FKBP-type peptidyl-prolyl cis-trans isomerase (trigger factor)
LETGQEPSPEDSHIDVEPLREVFGEQALESIRGQLILNRLETDLGVTVTPDDIDAEVASMAAQTAQNPNALKQQLERRGGLDTIRGRLQERQVFQALIDQMQITDRVVSEAELAPAADETATEL